MVHEGVIEEWLKYALKHGSADIRNPKNIRIISFEIIADLWIFYPRTVE